MADMLIDEFLADVPEERRETIRTLHNVIVERAPELAPKIWPMAGKSMIGYGDYHYRYASGREGDWFVIGVASQKQYISVYVCASDEHGYLAESRKDRLGKVSVGKSCIRFKRLDQLDLNEFRRLVSDAAAAFASGDGFSM
jgi:uncharacterized protein YdhG (YjbR/CyaY superfamily)